MKISNNMQKENHQHHTCFQWLQLIITFSIPVVIVVYTVLQDNRRLEIASRNRAQDLDISDDQHKDSILQDCQKTISKLIEKYGIQLNGTQSATLVAHFSVISAFNELDPFRRSFLIHLLYDARLITYQSSDNRPAISLQSANLTDINLMNFSHTKSLQYVSFTGAYMTRANFREMKIDGVKFDRARLQYADFSSSSNDWGCDNMDCDRNRKQKICFQSSNLTSASFIRALYTVVLFDKAHMINANLQWLICAYCSFQNSDLNNADFDHSTLDHSSFLLARLIGTNFNEAKIGPDVDFDHADMRFVKAKKIYLENCQFTNTDLREGVFDYATIKNTTFEQAIMIKLSMQFSNVINGDFSQTNLFAANWQSIRCEWCMFNHTNMTNVNLFNAVFVESNFRNCYLSEKQLKQAKFLNCTMM